MNLRDYISTYGGFVGLIAFLTSIVVFFAFNKEVSLIINTLTLLTLNPYFTYQTYWEKQHDLFRVSPIWHGKFSSLISLIYVVNIAWYTYLVYTISNSVILGIGAFLIMILILPKILIYLMIKQDEFE